MLPIKPIEQIIIALEMNAGHNTIIYFKNTPGVQKADVEELSEWVKTIQIKSIVPLNLFFIPFSSGRYAIGRVTPNCNENPETLPERYNIFVQVMVVTPGTLLAYGNNPILVYQAALHSGTLHQILPHDNKISTIHLGNSPKWIDKSILLGLSVNPGIRAITFLMETILTHPQTLFIGDTQPFFVILALFNLLPIHSRVKLTFANSIFPGNTIPIRLLGIHKTDNLEKIITDYSPAPLRLCDITLFPWKYPLKHNWAMMVEQVLQTKAFEFFYRRIIEEFLYRCNKNDDVDSCQTPSPALIDELGKIFQKDLKKLLKLQENWGEQGMERSGSNASENASPLPDDLEYLIPSSRNNHKKPSQDSDFSKEESPDTPQSTSRTSDPSINLSDTVKKWLINTDAQDAIYFGKEPDVQHQDTSWNPPREETIDRLFRNIEIFCEAGKKGIDDSKIPENRCTSDAPQKQLSYASPLIVYDKYNQVFSPYQQLLAKYPDLSDKLICLDKLVGNAVQATPLSMEELNLFWEKIKEETDLEIQLSIREEYIRYIYEILSFVKDTGKITDIPQSVVALEILNLFFNE